MAKEGRTLARQSQDAVASLQAKVGVLEAKLAETQSQAVALEAMYQELSSTRDERVLAEVEQAVTIAMQQLQFAGNVEAALICAAGRRRPASPAPPSRSSCRSGKLIARDIERLKATPGANVSGLSLKIESVVAAVDGLPLAYEQRPKADVAAKPVPAASKPASTDHWRELGADLWRELRQLVRIERIDQTDPGAAGAQPELTSCVKTSSCACSTPASPCCSATARPSARKSASRASSSSATSTPAPNRCRRHRRPSPRWLPPTSAFDLPGSGRDPDRPAQPQVRPVSAAAARPPGRHEGARPVLAADPRRAGGRPWRLPRATTRATCCWCCRPGAPRVSLNLFLLRGAGRLRPSSISWRAPSATPSACRAPWPQFRRRRREQRSRPGSPCATPGACSRKGATATRMRCAEKAESRRRRRRHAGAGRLARGTRPARCRSGSWNGHSRVRGHDSAGLQAARLMDGSRVRHRGAPIRRRAAHALQPTGRAPGPPYRRACASAMRAEQGLGNWREVARLVRQLEKHQALTRGAGCAYPQPCRARSPARPARRPVGPDRSAPGDRPAACRAASGTCGPPRRSAGR
jgi:hypothetical protein